MSTYTLDRSRIEDIEVEVSPPMKMAITIPVLVDGENTGLAIYVAASGFNNDKVRENELRRIAKLLTFGYPW